MDRCTLTDLYTDQCAHCRGIEDPAHPTVARWWMEARFHGACAGCERHIEPGDRICFTNVAWCEGCGEAL